MDRIRKAFTKGHKVFIPYLTVGFPSVDESVRVANILVEGGADILELGYPFSDPTADGNVIQASSQFALDNGFTREDYFKVLSQVRQKNENIPIVVFTYFNPVYQFGVRAFIERIKKLGADAAIIVDLPIEEQQEILPTLNEFQIHLIQLIAPTTPEDRVKKILQNASGFVYQISVKGVTGLRDSLPIDVENQIKKIKSYSKLPIALGFGISTPDQIRELSPTIDGVVVGSALVGTIQANLPNYQKNLTVQSSELAKTVHRMG